MWLLPDWFPFHPGRLWCHCRMVYLPMGYIYSRRFTYQNADTDKITAALRQELYVPGSRYESIQWDAARHAVADIGKSGKWWQFYCGASFRHQADCTESG